MTRRKDIDRAPIIVTKTRNGLSPVGPHEQELLDRYPLGAHLEITVKQRRSSKQQALYWAMLAYVNKSTEAYPNAEKLHDAVKDYLGYYTVLRRLDGTEKQVLDSTAFSAMDQAAFKIYFDQAVRALTEQFHFDPLGFMHEERKAA